LGGGDIVEMMRSETIFPLDLELCINGSQTRRKETVWLTVGQYEVLEIVTRALDQSISKWLTEIILSMLECELDSTVPWELQKKLERGSQKSEQL
jgi:hypothetical protein